MGTAATSPRSHREPAPLKVTHHSSSSDLMRARSSSASHEGRRKEMLSSVSVMMTPYGVVVVLTAAPRRP